MQVLKKVKLKHFLPVLGAALGYAYYYFIGCQSGKCPIQSNPYISTLYGALVASVFLFPEKKKAPDNAGNN